ncbi:MAG: type II toxin-antitoxin system ParD family antitoxin [Bacteroidia bacterium]|jgi:antitoxin ParD1/3/4
MAKNTSISLGDHFENFVEESLSLGRYQNASEVIRAGLRLLEIEENKLIALKKAIDEGVNSGINSDFNPQNHLEMMKKKRKKNA